MAQALENLAVADGDPVRTEHIASALTAGSFSYDDGATQTFEPGGGTTYVEHRQRSHGEWSVDSEGRFCSFWPPNYRACYDLHWIVQNGSVVGLRFTELDRGSVLSGVTGDTTLATYRRNRRSRTRARQGCGAAAIGATSGHSVTRRRPGPVAASASCALQVPSSRESPRAASRRCAHRLSRTARRCRRRCAPVPGGTSFSVSEAFSASRACSSRTSPS